VSRNREAVVFEEVRDEGLESLVDLPPRGSSVTRRYRRGPAGLQHGWSVAAGATSVSGPRATG